MQESNDSLPLEKILNFHNATILIKSGFNKKSKITTTIRCHDMLVIPMHLTDIVISNINGSDYRSIISKISKSEAIKFLQKADLNEKVERFKR